MLIKKLMFILIVFFVIVGVGAADAVAKNNLPNGYGGLHFGDKLPKVFKYIGDVPFGEKQYEDPENLGEDFFGLKPARVVYTFYKNRLCSVDIFLGKTNLAEAKKYLLKQIEIKPCGAAAPNSILWQSELQTMSIGPESDGGVRINLSSMEFMSDGH